MKSNGLERLIRNIMERARRDKTGRLIGYTSALKALEDEIKRQTQKDLKKSETAVKQALSREYYGFKKAGFKKSVPGLAAYKLDDLTPALRRELKRKTEEALSYIQSANETNMNNLKNRFINWATNPTPVADEGLKVEPISRKERAVIKDQTQKLEGNLAEIVAKESGAWGYVWHNRKDRRVVGNPAGLYPDGGNETHGNHWEREGKIYLLDDSPALRYGWIKPTKNYPLSSTLTDGRPKQAPGCRCWAAYLYKLSDAPEEILTEKGVKRL